MRQFYFTEIVLLSLVLLSACHKEENLKIEYPSSGFYGVNVLSLNDSDTLSSSVDYSLSAKLGKKAELKIVFTNLSNQVDTVSQSTWFYSDKDGWNVGDYNGDKQDFVSNKSGVIDLDMTFEGSQGKCRIDFYENSDAITKSKILYW